MKYSILVSVVVVIGFVGKVYTHAICSGIDVTNDPRITGKMLDGHWYTQLGMTTTRISNSITFYQYQGRVEWHNDWNEKTQACSYRQYETRHVQSAENGPYSPCFNDRQLLPLEDAQSVGEDYLFYMPTKNLLMFFLCPPGQVRNNDKCAVRPFVRVLTRTLDITQKEKSIIRMRLRRLGVNQPLDVNNPRLNKCRLPEQESVRRPFTIFDQFQTRATEGSPGQGGGYGRKNKQW